jgi:hypothetical protein
MRLAIIRALGLEPFFVACVEWLNRRRAVQWLGSRLP